MRVLLDTHILLWWLGGEQARIDDATRRTLADPAVGVLFSAASIWEIAIKARLGRESFGVRPTEIVRAAEATGFTELPVRASAAAIVAELPLRHRDPFDRLLIAQAMAEPARFLSADAVIAQYSDLVTLIR